VTGIAPRRPASQRTSCAIWREILYSHRRVLVLLSKLVAEGRYRAKEEKKRIVSLTLTGDAPRGGTRPTKYHLSSIKMSVSFTRASSASALWSCPANVSFRSRHFHFFLKSKLRRTLYNVTLYTEFQFQSTICFYDVRLHRLLDYVKVRSLL